MRFTPNVRLPAFRLSPWLFAVVFALEPFLAFAQRNKRGGGGGSAVDAAVNVDAVSPDSFASRPLVLMLALAALSLVPFVLMMVTSFVKISVVLSIVRSALGTQQIPPTQVITGLGIILTVYIMAPVGQAMYRASEVDILAKGPSLMSSESVGNLLEAEEIEDALASAAARRDATSLGRFAGNLLNRARKEG